MVMTAAEIRRANQQLLDAAARLTDEMSDIPAGAVLRCFSRAVRMARAAGCPSGQLATEADRLARRFLALRGGVPRQRRS